MVELLPFASLGACSGRWWWWRPRLFGGRLGRAGLLRRRRGRSRHLPARGRDGAVVFPAAAFVGEDPVRLGELGGAIGRHHLKFPAEMLNLVRVVSRDLQAEGALHLVGGRGGRNIEELVIVLERHLLLELRDVGGR